MGLANTAVQYLGVTKSNGNYAVFVLGVNATSDGEATCEDAGCRVFGPKSGQTQLVTVQPPDGGEARQYNLYVPVGQVPHGGRGHCTDDAHQGPCRRGLTSGTVTLENSTTRDALKGIRFDRDSGLAKSATSPADAPPQPSPPQ